MAVVGPHAMGLWQTDVDQTSSTTYHKEFHAVRFRIDIEKWRRGESELPIYWEVFSSGCQNLDDQVGKLVEEVLARM